MSEHEHDDRRPRLTFEQERARATLYALVLREQGFLPSAIVAALKERYPRVQVNFVAEEGKPSD